MVKQLLSSCSAGHLSFDTKGAGLEHHLEMCLTDLNKEYHHKISGYCLPGWEKVHAVQNSAHIFKPSVKPFI